MQNEFLTAIHGHAAALLDAFLLYETKQKAVAQREGPWRVSFARGDFYEHILAQRDALVALLRRASDDQITACFSCDVFFDAGEKLRGCLIESEADGAEEATDVMNKGWSHPHSRRAFLIVSLCRQAFELSFVDPIGWLTDAQVGRVLGFFLRQPHMMRLRDPALYLSFYARLFAWIDTWIDASAPRSWMDILRQKLTLGACFYIDGSTRALWEARGRMLMRLNAQDPALKNLPVLSASSNNARRRIGILLRTLKNFTDTRAMYSFFHGFDKTRYELYAYELDSMDSVPADSVFDGQLDAFISVRRTLQGTVETMARSVLADDLDIFVLATAVGTGAKDVDRLLACRLGRISVSLAALVAGTTGLPSFDYYVVSEEQATCWKMEATETLIPIKGPLLRYALTPLVAPRLAVSRHALGIPENAVIYASGAALNKLMPQTLSCWLSVLTQVPHAVLLLFPFNPSWGGYFIAHTFFARLREALKAFPDLDPARIVVVREVAPDDFERLIALSDIYLGSFPRDGGTAAAHALRYAKPLIARREGPFHAHNDALMLRAFGQEAWIGATDQDVAARAVTLGLDPALRHRVAQEIAARRATTAVFDLTDQTAQMRQVIDSLVSAP